MLRNVGAKFFRTKVVSHSLSRSNFGFRRQMSLRMKYESLDDTAQDMISAIAGA